jgi:hypothetical protein
MFPCKFKSCSCQTGPSTGIYMTMCVNCHTVMWYHATRWGCTSRSPHTSAIRAYVSKISFSMALPGHSGPCPLVQFRNHFSQTVGLLGRVISPSQGRYLNTGQHRCRINVYTHQTFMPWVGFEPIIPASGREKTVRPRGYCDRICNQDTIHEIRLTAKKQNKERGTLWKKNR